MTDLERALTEYKRKEGANALDSLKRQAAEDALEHLTESEQNNVLDAADRLQAAIPKIGDKISLEILAAVGRIL